jgi:hypothetical protein
MAESTIKTTAKKPAAKAAPAAAKATEKKVAPAKKPVAAKAAEKKPVAKPAAGKAKALSAEQRYRMVAEAAYYNAERNGFKSDPVRDWIEAENQIAAMLDKKK